MAGKPKASSLYTLTEVSKKTGISMPTLQRYKKLYASRIPSEGAGRTQRYPESSLAVFEALKEENLKRRGRPRKDSSAKAAPKKPARKVTRKKPAAKAAAAEPAPKKAAKAAPVKKTSTGRKLLTLTEVGKRTGISYPTLLRYVRAHIARIPHEGTGRARRFPIAAVAVFKEIRDETSKNRGGRKATAKKATAAKPKAKAAVSKPAAKATKRVARKVAAKPAGDPKMSARLQALEKAHRSLVKEITKLQKAVQRPIQIKVTR